MYYEQDIEFDEPDTGILWLYFQYFIYFLYQ